MDPRDKVHTELTMSGIRSEYWLLKTYAEYVKPVDKSLNTGPFGPDY